MKSLLAGLLVGAVLVPAARVKQEETARGSTELVNTVAESVANASAKNAGHTWIKTRGYNFTQQYALQKELQKKGYDFDIPLFGSAFVGW